MTDSSQTSLVERLRKAKQYANGGATLPNAETCHEAANLIEQQAACIAALEAQLEDRDGWEEAIRREALEGR